MNYKILLPTDFSNNSWNAIKYVLQLFEDKQCTFLLLNTFTPILYKMEYTASPHVYDMDSIGMDTSLRGLKDIKEKILNEFKNSKHTFETISSFNSLIPEIKKISARENINLVVMGTKGATGIEEILFGSNTVHALKNSKCPLLAIPDEFEFKPISTVLFSTDYEHLYTETQITPIYDITKKNNATLHIINVSYGYELSDNQKNNKETLKAYFKDLNTTFHSIPDKNIEEAINDFQLENNIDLLTMINNKHSIFEKLFFRSVIKHIGFHIDIPFLVIPTL